MSEIKARTTMYKGIKMRSRLEADYAASLDRKGEIWKYEPTCFAGADGQWLPDFLVSVTDGQTYVELKPAYLLERQAGEGPDGNIDRIDTLLQRMAVAWLSEPNVWLELIFWTYGATEPDLAVVGHPTRPWVVFGLGLPRFPLIWTGMGQLETTMRSLPAFAGAS